MDLEAARLWSDPETPAICLMAMAVDRNPETEGRRLLCLNWTLQTWRDELTHQNGSPPNQRAFDRFGAALGLMHNPDEFYHSVPGFSNVCEGLASEWFESSVDHVLTTDEVVRGLIEAHLLHPPEDDQNESFSPAVIRFVNWTVRNDGFSKLPDMIKAFGIPTDPGFDWGHDLSGDPMLAEMAVAGDEDKQDDLVSSSHDYLLELADRIEKLPLRTMNPRPVAEDIRKRIPGIPTK